MRILIIEDDLVLLDGLKAGLALLGATVDTVACCADGYAALSSTSFDAVVLDLMLTDGSGLDLLRRVRSEGNNVPVLLLTALDEIGDRIKGLDSGADDYLGKPFDLDELGARVRAIVRRKEGRVTPTLRFNGIELDPATLAVSVDAKPVQLSRREFAVLATLLERPGTTRSKADLEDRIYGWQDEVESNAVEVHIHNLRSKIGRDYIETVRGIGYRMRAVAP
ncbi:MULTISPECIES: response regulator [Rhodopseudomonas]|uniref:Transcriptional regulator n=1 Tax=Rhodopseudomonas palustris TaxID=1076 RepID=A0A0D7E0V8_RHOPL|nr:MULTISPECIES: response regulator [Rhodopseudomonas]KIZ34115.1 transcriptional regulator [Rhodopseudomonas palustris]MDF3812718.1 response regulator [Rhodopseudomonas sp. BAL398]WOK15780.1 response regulator [Rhodopseudomonas sp. BAL398]